MWYNLVVEGATELTGYTIADTLLLTSRWYGCALDKCIRQTTGGIFMSKRITLSRDKFAIVDDADYEWLNQWKWSCATNGYAVRRIPGTNKIVLMHREIMGNPKGVYVDHINRDTLDNRRANLRTATPAQSIRNTRARKGFSPFKGVTKSNQKWAARIQILGKTIELGLFETQREAAAAYNEAAKIHFGEYAFLNDLSLLPPEQDKPLCRKLTSKYTGVHWDKQSQMWKTEIMVNYQKHRLGFFDCEIDAAKAYDLFVKKNGIKRKTNF